MKTINLTERQVIVLKSLLVQEIDYLEKEAILLISILFTNYININNQNKIGSNLK